MSTNGPSSTVSGESSPGDATRRSIKEVMEHALARGDARRIYGEPVIRNGRTIVPVASIGSAFGFGSGAGGAPDAQGEGGGGGGRVSGRPVGCLEITDDGSCFKPVYDVTRLGIWGIAAVAFLLWTLIRKR